MKLILEKLPAKGKKYAQYEAYLDMKLGRMPMRDFLRKKVSAYKGRRFGDPRGTYTSLLASAGTEHVSYYNYVAGKSGFTLAMLNLILALGYDIEIVKELGA